MSQIYIFLCFRYYFFNVPDIHISCSRYTFYMFQINTFYVPDTHCVCFRNTFCILCSRNTFIYVQMDFLFSRYTFFMFQIFIFMFQIYICLVLDTHFVCFRNTFCILCSRNTLCMLQIYIFYVPDIHFFMF
jgi:hypothetical protein